MIRALLNNYNYNITGGSRGLDWSGVLFLLTEAKR